MLKCETANDKIINKQINLDYSVPSNVKNTTIIYYQPK